MNSDVFDVAVIGGGGAGQMALLRAVLSHLKTVAFLGGPASTKRSRATWVPDVENIPGFFGVRHPIPATTHGVIKFVEGREDLSGCLTHYRQDVIGIQKTGEGFLLQTEKQEATARYVILCTGTMDIQPEIGGSIDPILPYANRGEVFYCIRCDGHRTVGKRCAVIGSSEGAAWIAVMLHERYELPAISLLPHGQPLQISERLQSMLKAYAISVIEGEICEVLGDPDKGLEGFRVGDQRVEAAVAFVEMGSLVYNDLAKQLGAELDERKHVITDERGQTSVDGFYAAGDLVSGKKKQVYTAWDMAVDAVDHIDRRLRAEKRKRLMST